MKKFLIFVTVFIFSINCFTFASTKPVNIWNKNNVIFYGQAEKLYNREMINKHTQLEMWTKWYAQQINSMKGKVLLRPTGYYTITPENVSITLKDFK